MLDYAELSASLESAGAVVAAAEVHGGVCGALCAGGEPAALRWLADCLVDQELSADAAPVANALQGLVEASWRALSDESFAFEPLLPDDEAPLAEQVEALALWCHGFLGGVASNAGAGSDASDSSAKAAFDEVLVDFAEISRAGLSDEEAAGEDQPDFALAELHEYVRAGVQVVFDELAEPRAAAARLH